MRRCLTYRTVLSLYSINSIPAFRSFCAFKWRVSGRNSNELQQVLPGRSSNKFQRSLQYMKRKTAASFVRTVVRIIYTSFYIYMCIRCR